MTQRLSSLKNKREWIRKKHQFLENAMATDTKEAALLEMPEQYYISRRVAQNDERQWAVSSGELLKECEKYGLRNVYGFGYRQELSYVLSGNCNQYDTVYLLFDEKPREAEYTVRKGGTYVASYHTGHWNTIAEAYTRLLICAKQHGITLEGPCYEDFLFDGLTKKSPEEYVTRVICRSAQNQEK